MNYIILLITMLFFHIVDDYYLQGFLASAKQKSWWEKNCPDKLYEHDYLMALAEHSFSWTFMIHVPIIVYAEIFGLQINVIVFSALFIMNILSHAITDNAKANWQGINLIQNQLIHISLIVLTWAIYLLSF